MNTVRIGRLKLGRPRAPLFVIAGPCVIESEALALRVAEKLADICARLKLPFIFKASFDKANRTAGDSFRGPGLVAGLRILAKVKSRVGVPVLTDVHEVAQCAPAAEVVDVLQIPAFLCRQTDLIEAAARTGRCVNIKKGQFLAPADVRHAIAKVRAAGSSFYWAMRFLPEKKRAATLDLIEALISTCDEDTAGVRDRALIAVGFASGGRRRSELAGMTMDHLEEAPGGYVITLPFSKTDQEGKGKPVPVIGRAAVYLEAWLLASGIEEGPLFRRLSKSGKVLEPGLTGYGISTIIKKRACKAGMNSKEFAGHSLRSGFITETGRQGRSLADAMAMSGHRSTTVALDYHQAGAVILNPCARVMERESER